MRGGRGAGLEELLRLVDQRTGADAFPITSFSWVYLRPLSEPARAAALSDFLDWIYTDGQQYAAQEGYAALPPPLLAALRKKVKDLH